MPDISNKAANTLLNPDCKAVRSSFWASTISASPASSC